MAREMSETDVQKDILKTVAEAIQQCWAVYYRLKDLKMTDASQKDNALVLLILYDFECKMRLKDSTAESLLHRMVEMPKPDPKTFEAMAALAAECCKSSNRFRNLVTRSLKLAIKQHLLSTKPDFVHCSKLIHRLIDTTLANAELSKAMSQLEEPWIYFNDALDVIKTGHKDGYPQIEILWLMIRGWNLGATLYSIDKYEEAEKWCGLSMKFLSFISEGLKVGYQLKMTEIYSEILSKLRR